MPGMAASTCNSRGTAANRCGREHPAPWSSAMPTTMMAVRLRQTQARMLPSPFGRAWDRLRSAALIPRPNPTRAEFYARIGTGATPRPDRSPHRRVCRPHTGRPARREVNVLRDRERESPQGSLRRIATVLWAGLALSALSGIGSLARAQAIEPRLYSNAPVGLNFLLVGFAHSSGGVALDPSAPIEDASIDVDSPFVAYVRSLGVAGQSAKFQFLLPYAWLYGEGIFGPTGEFLTRDVDGFGEPALRVSV